MGACSQFNFLRFVVLLGICFVACFKLFILPIPHSSRTKLVASQDQLPQELQLELRLQQSQQQLQQPQRPGQLQQLQIRRRPRQQQHDQNLHQQLPHQLRLSPRQQSQQLHNFTPDLHIFYYPWYGTPLFDDQYLHWNHKTIKHWQIDIATRFPEVTHQPPDDIGASFFPQLGCYSSKDPDAVRAHTNQIASAGIGVLVVSWYHPNEHDANGISLDALFPLILNESHKRGLKVAFHMEPYEKRSIETLKRDLEYIVSTYESHPALYRVRHLPVFYVYDSYHLQPNQWAGMLACESGPACVRGTKLDGVFFGLAVEAAHLDHLANGGFDGIYTYFAVDGFSWGSTMQNWVHISKFATDHGMLLSVSVGPGYDDVAVRPWNGANTRSRSAGVYYDTEWRAALAANPAFVSITSFNEWHEGTQIEPAVPFQKYKDYLPKDPEYYLRKTSEWARVMRPLHFAQT